MLIGTVAYLSPEQLERGKADARSDVYAAGIVLFEMLTGHPPFGGDTPLAVAYQHVHHDVPTPSEEVPGLAWQVDELVARTTRRDPVVRPLDAGAFLADLEDVRSDVGIPRVPVPTGRSSAGPDTLRPTNRPTRPADRPAAAPQRPGDGTEVLGGGRPRGSRTSMLPGMGAGPTTDVAGARPAPPRPRPGVPDHIRRRRTRLAVAVVVLLAVTIGAIGWWFGSGRWTTVPELVGLDREAADRPAAGGRARPGLLRGGLQRDRPRRRGDLRRPGRRRRDPRHRRPPRRLQGPGALPRRRRLGRPAHRGGRAPAGAASCRCVHEVQDYDDNVAGRARHRLRPGAGHRARRATPPSRSSSAAGTRPWPCPTWSARPRTTRQATLEQLGFTVEQRPRGRSPDVDTGEVMAVSPGSGESAPYASTVTIQVSEGLPRVDVPDVRGMDADEAQRRSWRRLGLQVEVSTFIAGSTVRIQNPSGGEVVDWGTTVRLLAAF